RLAEILREHRRDGDADRQTLGLLGENDRRRAIALRHAIVAALRRLDEDFERPRLEHLPEQRAVMLSATLAVADDHEVLIAELRQQRVEVLRDEREARGGLVPRGIEH